MCLFRHGGVGAHCLRWHQAKGKCFGEVDQRQRQLGEGDRADQGADAADDSDIGQYRRAGEPDIPR